MSELKIEIGKYYKTRFGDIAYAAYIVPDKIRSKCHLDHGIIIHVKNKNGFSFVNVDRFGYMYNELLERFLVSEWQEEPKVGWVYEDWNKIPFNIVYTKEDGRGKKFLGINMYSDSTDWFTTHGYYRNIDELKLETGRPAEDL